MSYRDASAAGDIYRAGDGALKQADKGRRDIGYVEIITYLPAFAAPRLLISQEGANNRVRVSEREGTDAE